MAVQQKYVNKIKGDRVLIIGGTSGVGYADAEGCIDEGCTVVITGSRTTSGSDALARLHSSYPSAKDHASSLVLNLSWTGSEADLDNSIKTCLEEATESGTKKLDHIAFTAGDSYKLYSGPP